MSEMNPIETVHVQYDRNGITGEGFHRVRFWWTDDSDTSRLMLAVVFDYEEWERDREKFRNPTVAVIDLLEVVGDPSVPNGYPDPKGYSAWRGDHFADELYLAIARSTDRWKDRIHS